MWIMRTSRAATDDLETFSSGILKKLFVQLQDSLDSDAPCITILIKAGEKDIKLSVTQLWPNVTKAFAPAGWDVFTHPVSAFHFADQVRFELEDWAIKKMGQPWNSLISLLEQRTPGFKLGSSKQRINLLLLCQHHHVQWLWSLWYGLRKIASKQGKKLIELQCRPICDRYKLHRLT